MISDNVAHYLLVDVLKIACFESKIVKCYVCMFSEVNIDINMQKMGEMKQIITIV